MKHEIMEAISDTAALKRRLLELCNERGGAWSFSIMPFSHDVLFYHATSPSRLPDWLIDESRAIMPGGAIAYKGKFQGFTDAAIIREQNRGVTCQ